MPYPTGAIGSTQTIPKADVTQGSKFVMQFDIFELGTPTGNPASPYSTVAFMCDPFATSGVGKHGTRKVYLSTSQWATTVTQVLEPATNEIWLNGAKYEDSKLAITDFGFHANIIDAQKEKGREYATLWFEFYVDTGDMTVFYGYNDGTTDIEKNEGGTIKKLFTLDDTVNEYWWSWMFNCEGGNFELDNYKLYRAVENEDNKYYINFDFEDSSKIKTDYAGAEAGDLVLVSGDTGTGKLKTKDTVVTVTNPNKDARIVSLNKLEVDNRLEKTFEMQSAFKLVNFGNESTRKVGVALGLDDYKAVLSAPKNGASFIYLTENEEGQIVLGADNIAEDGTATAAGEQTVINGAALNATISLNITGKKDGSVDVTVGEQTVNFKDIKANGNVAIAQTGEGEVTFSVLANDFKVTGYQLTENEGEKVTSSFNGNWTSPAKFFFRNNIAPSAHVTAVEGGHAVTGMTPENGKVGFYGTSTNTALTFLKPYADFVMQFDYISVPYKQRGKLGGIETGGDANRFSPLYAVFGGESGESAIAEYYALGIVEGNATQYFWGAESLIAPEGKLLREGATLKEVSKGVDTEDSETAIPKYGKNPVEGGKPAFTVNGYIKPADEEKSFYNKTTRFKLVVINNNVALWAANVDENGAVTDDYRKVYECTVKNSFGYVGFITDSPAWCELDNIAITPISTQTALDKGLNAEPAADLVADVPVSEMAADPMPEMLAKPVLTADTAAKKVTWNAIEGAGEYAVTVSFNGEEVDSKTVTATEYDMSKYTDKGDYTVSVVAIPADLEAYQKSLNANITYTVSDDGNGSGDNKPGGNETETNEPDEGCGCGGSVNGALGSAAIVLILGGVAILIRRRKA